MKKITAIALSVVLLLSGCNAKTSGYTMIGSVEVTSDNSVELSYKKLNGTKSYDISLSDGDVIAVEVTTNSGTLKLEIARENQEPVYTGSDFPEGGFTVNISEAGYYTVSLTGEDHSGEVKLEW